MRKVILYFVVLSAFVLSSSAKAQWTKANATFHASYFYPWINDSVFAISDGKLYLSPDQGASWEQMIQTTQVHSIVATTNGVLYCATNNQIYRADNWGGNWKLLTTTGKPPVITSLFARASAPGVDELFLGAKDGMYKTTSLALDWVAISEEAEVKEFAVSGDKIYARSLSSILRSSDGGQSWKTIDTTSVGFTGFAVSGNNVFAMISSPPGGSIDHSADGGDNWLGPLYFSFGAATFNKMVTNDWGDVYICGGLRSDANPDSIAQGYVYRWLNGAPAWEFYNTGLPNADLVGLGFGYKGRVYTSSDSDGVYKTLEALQHVTTVTDNIAVSETYPNPAATAFSIQVDSKTSTRAFLELYDLRGFLRSVVSSYNLATGANTITLAPGDLPNGIYVLRMVIDGTAITRRVTISR